MRCLIAAAALPLAGCLALASPALAQDSNDNDKVNQLIVYGNDPCPPSTGNEITVCARKSESERYRIPEEFRGSASPQNDAWNNKVLAYETVGATGTLSCSPVGAGGSLGCTQKMINAAYAERRTGGVQMSQLIDAERAKRLSNIDAEAAATQARVEQAEREYQAREAAAQDGTTNTVAPVAVPPAQLNPGK